MGGECVVEESTGGGGCDCGDRSWRKAGGYNGVVGRSQKRTRPPPSAAVVHVRARKSSSATGTEAVSLTTRCSCRARREVCSEVAAVMKGVRKHRRSTRAASCTRWLAADVQAAAAATAVSKAEVGVGEEMMGAPAIHVCTSTERMHAAMRRGRKARAGMEWARSGCSAYSGMAMQHVSDRRRTRRVARRCASRSRRADRRGRRVEPRRPNTRPDSARGVVPGRWKVEGGSSGSGKGGGRAGESVDSGEAAGI